MGGIGGFLGCMLFGSLTKYVPLRRLTIISLLLGFVGVVIFGQGAEDINHLKAVTAFAGFFTNAAIVGMYTMLHCISRRSARRARVLPSAQVALAHFYHPSSQAFCLSGAGRSARSYCDGRASLVGVIMLLLLRDADQLGKAIETENKS